MDTKYQKYINETGTTLGYLKAIPPRVLHISPTTLFTYLLDLSRTARDATIASAWAQANKGFTLHLKTLTNCRPAAYKEIEIERL